MHRNPRRACAARVTVVRLSVCLCMSVSQHLASVRLENAVTHSAGSEGQNDWVNFSETTPLQRFTASCIVWLQIGRPFCMRA